MKDIKTVVCPCCGATININKDKTVLSGRQGLRVLHIPSNRRFISIREAIRKSNTSYATIRKSHEWKVFDKIPTKVIECNDGVHGDCHIAVADDGQMSFF